MLVGSQLRRSFEQLNPGMDEQDIDRLVENATQCWTRTFADALEHERLRFMDEQGYIPVAWDDDRVAEQARRLASEYMCGEFMIGGLDGPEACPVAEDTARLEAEHQDALRNPDGWKTHTWAIRVSPEIEALTRALFGEEESSLRTFAAALFERERTLGRDVPSGKGHPDYWRLMHMITAAVDEWRRESLRIEDVPPATAAMRDIDMTGMYELADVEAAVLQWSPDASPDLVQRYRTHLRSTYLEIARDFELRLITLAYEHSPYGPDAEWYAHIRQSSMDYAAEQLDERHFTEGGFNSFSIGDDKRIRHLRAMCAPDGWKRILDIEVSPDAMDRATRLFGRADKVQTLFAATWLEHRMFRGLPMPEDSRHPVDMDMVNEVSSAREDWFAVWGR